VVEDGSMRAVIVEAPEIDLKVEETPVSELRREKFF